MITIPQLSDQLQLLFTTTANKLAKEQGVIRRQRKVTGAGFAQALVFGGIAHPSATRKQQQQAAVHAGMRVTHQALEQRFTPAAVDFMRQLFEAALNEAVKSQNQSTLLPQFNGVYVTDCTRLEWKGSGVKMAVRWELQRGQLQASLGEITQHDQKTAPIDAPLPAGALHLGDLGFFKLDRFRAWSEAGVFWLSRFKVGTTLYHPDGQSINLLAHLKSNPHPMVLPVLVGAKAKMPAYLVAAPIPPEAHAKRMARLKEEARLDQKALSPQQSNFAPWTLYLTNLPNLSFEQAHTLARTRWQIELMFKLWKSHGKVLKSRSADPIRQQCEGYAKLLGVLVTHWLMVTAGWCLEAASPLDAFRVIQAYVPVLMRAFLRPALWLDLLAWLKEALDLLPSRTKRRQTPLAFQLWHAFDTQNP